MDLAARKASNLSVLRRHDPAIVDLLDQSSHAVVYSFDRSKAGWVCLLSNLHCSALKSPSCLAARYHLTGKERN
jgi:hypothetical protein